MLDSQTALDETREVLESLRDDPAGFQEIVLGRQLWAKQVEVCEAIARYPIVTVPAGRAVGKSYLLAGIALWWLYTRGAPSFSRVITTGPDHRQVVSVLWGELRAALRPRYGDDGRLVGPRLHLGFDHLTEGYSSPQRLTLDAGTRWEALGFACKSDEGFSGQHHPELLVIVDEASGVLPPIWSAIHGLAAKKLLICGNPIKYDCDFRALDEKAQKGSKRIGRVHISSLDHPDATKAESPIGAVSRSWLELQREIHGSEESPWWRSNVLGLFPGQDSVQFLPMAWLDACTRPSVQQDDLWMDYPAGPSYMGVDVGGGVGADRSVVVVRNRKQVLAIFASEWHGVLDDARYRLEPIVVELAKKWAVEPDRLTYDKGGLGRSFGSYLANHGLPGAIGYFGAGKGGKLYVNRRTANAFAIRRRLDPHRENHVPFYCGGLHEWVALRQELAELRSPTMEQEEGQVKQRLEDKEDLAARLHRSPDLLDALLMTFTYSE
jgi:hypothetical protein